MTQRETGGRFIRSGFWLLLLGFVMSFGMVMHYVVGAQYPTGEEFLRNVTLWYACPWTLLTAVVLGGALGMIAIGAVYAILGRYEHPAPVEGVERAALPLCTFALLAMFLTGMSAISSSMRSGRLFTIRQFLRARTSGCSCSLSAWLFTESEF
jgi:hypothetical protein